MGTREQKIIDIMMEYLGEKQVKTYCRCCALKYKIEGNEEKMQWYLAYLEEMERKKHENVSNH